MGSLDISCEFPLGPHDSLVQQGRKLEFSELILGPPIEQSVHILFSTSIIFWPAPLCLHAKTGVMTGVRRGVTPYNDFDQ